MLDKSEVKRQLESLIDINSIESINISNPIKREKIKRQR